jgi:hypothetical protein
MSQKQPLNFAQALRLKPVDRKQEIATEEESQLATMSASTQPTNPDNQPTTASAIQKATDTASSYPPASILPTNERKQLASRKSASQKPKRVDSRRGDRHAGNRVAFNTRLRAELVKEIKHFCVENGLELQEFTEMAAIHLMEYAASHQVAKPGSKQALDERNKMMLYKTSPSIINLYLQYNPENKWKVADDYEAQQYNDKDIRLIELGIIRTQFNAGFKKINSFKYYVAEIEEALAIPLGDETISIMLQRAKERWKTR